VLELVLRGELDVVVPEQLDEALAFVRRGHDATPTSGASAPTTPGNHTHRATRVAADRSVMSEQHGSTPPHDTTELSEEQLTASARRAADDEDAWCASRPAWLSLEDEPAPAAPPRAAPRGRGTVGPAIAIEWYDGPLLEIARVDLDHHDPLVEITTSLLCRVTGEWPRQSVVLRLSREHLAKMLDLVDGKPVEDHDGAIHQAADPAPASSTCAEDAPTPL